MQVILAVSHIDKNLSSKKFDFQNGITVQAWVDIDTYQPENLQSLVSQWPAKENIGELAAFDAGQTNGLDTKGYLGSVFDGRYVYFSPQANATTRKNGTTRHGIVLRYDTHKPYSDEIAWNAYDAGETDGMSARGFYGAVFDGRYVYFIPRTDGSTYHTRFLRYNTSLDFHDPNAWSCYNIGIPLSSQSAGFDGRYIYFAPGYADETEEDGRVIRYDTQSAFKSPDSYAVFDISDLGGLKTINFDGAVYDGRYIYLIPLSNSCPVRYDTRREFSDTSSWEAFDANYLDMRWRVGGVFDGRYIYYVPYCNGKVIRYDTSAGFDDRKAWELYNAAGTNGCRCVGYDGAMYDGRFIYFTPFWAGHLKKGAREKEDFHADILRYDVSGNFHDSSSWTALDARGTDGLDTRGYNAGAFDGRFVYFSAWNQGESSDSNVIGHGNMLRLDTTEGNAAFSLRLADCGHNGGLNASMPGPNFLVNTEKGAASVAGYCKLSSGKHLISGVYNGENIELYVDGRKIAERQASGTINKSSMPITLGRINGSPYSLNGKLLTVKICDEPLSPLAIENDFNSLSERDAFP